VGAQAPGERSAPEPRPDPPGSDRGHPRPPRGGQAEDIAAACAFLCRDEASYVAGQIIGVNGGRATTSTIF